MICFVTYDGFKNIYPVENKKVEEEKRKLREAVFFDSFKKEMELFENDKMAPMSYTYIMQNIYDWYLSDNTADRAMIEAKLKEFKKTGYKKTGIKFYDEGIEFMPKKPKLPKFPYLISINQEEHYFRNKLNIEYKWSEFERLNEILPEKYRWNKLTLYESALHQYSAKLGKWNKKYVSFDGYFEVVYSYDNELLNERTKSEDMGTYNYEPFSENAKRHIKNDMLPFNLWQNSYQDITNTF